MSERPATSTKLRILVRIGSSAATVVLLLVLVYWSIGLEMIIPLLETLQADRVLTGNTPSIWEAGLVFGVSLLYMAIITVTLVFAGVVGWSLPGMLTGGVSITQVRLMFFPEEPK